ncbi:MAG: hypothetical protein ACRCXT_01805 [Paraclostridium sp.]
MLKSVTLCEKICLTSLAYGCFEYFEVSSLDDIKEAYKDFDRRVANDTDIELQYIDGVLSGYSCSKVEEVFDLMEEYDEDIEVVRDLLNATSCIDDTKKLLENKNYMYFEESSKISALIEYLDTINFFDGLNYRFINYLDYSKIMRDFEFEGLQIVELDNKYLFIN